MADTFKFTLYQLFGYFFPGTVALTAVTLVDLVAFHHGAKPELEWMVSKPGVVVGIALSYLSGHAVQILANALLPRSNTAVLHSGKYKTTIDLFRRVKSKWPNKTASDDEIIKTCEHEVIAAGPGAEREIYVYREGFYRGTAISLATVSLACLLTVSIPTYRTFILQFGSSLPELMSVTIVSAILAIGMYVRSIRFADYRLSLALCYHLLPSPMKGEKKTGTAAAINDKEEKSDEASEDGKDEDDDA